MNKNFLILLTCLLVYPFPSFAHNYTGMVGFYDGISHPVLGLDHFLAMISVGILSAQIGGRAIWTVPSIFVCIMTIGGLIGFLFNINDHFFIELGITLSVILLGFGISIEKKIPITLIIIFVGIFGLFHGAAHGVEMPKAANPFLFVLGFICGTSTLHLFGVGIGYYLIKTTLSSILLRLTGIIFAFYGLYLLYLLGYFNTIVQLLFRVVE